IHAKARGKEFSAPIPGNENDENYEGGRAPELQLHLKNEVFPLIDSLYTRTLPFRTLIGHSSGGTFVLYTLFSEQKDLFDAYIAISPGIRSDSEYVIDNAAKVLEAGEKFPKFLYCSSGTVGEREFLFGNAVSRLDSIINSHPDHQLIWHKSTFEGTGHWTCVSPSFNTAMIELTRTFRVDEQQFFEFSEDESLSMITQLDNFYANVNDQYGFSDIPLPYYIDQAARWIADNGRYQAALETYDWALTHYLNHYRLTKAKAKVLLRTDRNEETLATLRTCLVLIENEKEKHDEEWYQNQQEYLNEKIAKVSK
ncbi:MAG: alpha/beta hydrolase-fold protein, partial [Bacteroidota bacterium]